MSLWLAQVAGFYDKEGLDVKIDLAPGVTVSLIVGGRDDVGYSGAATALVPVDSGIETSIIYAVSTDTVSAYVAGAPGVNSLTDCTRIATTAAGTSSYAWARAYAALPRVTHDVVPLSDPSTLAATLISGRANCGIGPAVLMTSAIDQAHFRFIVDPSNPATLPAGYPKGYVGVGAAVWGLKSTFERRRGDMVKFIRALRHADELIRKTSPSELASLLRKSDDWKPVDAEVLSKQIESVKPFLAPHDGMIEMSEWPEQLKHFSYANEKIKPDDPKWAWKSRVDNSYNEQARK
jgi:ABC-type nitrate/sulfonate/bicarbonate transport system substrate-binding protein